MSDLPRNPGSTDDHSNPGDRPTGAGSPSGNVDLPCGAAVDLPRDMGDPPRDWLPTLARLLQHESVVIRVVIAEVRGSAPREPGAFMLVARSGLEGTIGGGRLEWESVAAAQALLDESAEAAQLNKVVLGADLGQCCGGVVTIWLERFKQADLNLLNSATNAGTRGRSVLITTVTSTSVKSQSGADVESKPKRSATVDRRVVREAGAGVDADRLLSIPRAQARPVVTRNANGDLTFLERLDDPLPAIWLYGAGHVGQALARILMELPIRLTWIDSRSDLFPQLDRPDVRILREADPVPSVLSAPTGAYFLVMTHSHPVDYALCRAILNRNDFAWLGLIGSMSKAARFRSRLARDGLAIRAIKKLVSPIGIPGIASKWPAAIAVGVAAQLLQEISAAACEQPEVPRPSRPQPAVLGAKEHSAPPTHLLEPCGAKDCSTCGSLHSHTVVTS